MSTEYKKNIIAILMFLAFGLAIFPETLFAASAYLNSNSQNVYPGDVFVVEVRISSPDELINVVDGTLFFDSKKATVKELSTGGSVFSLWAEQPSFSNSKGTVRFVGGVPDGFKKEGGLVLKIIFLATNEGKFTGVLGNDSAAFLSDGKGTKVILETTPIVISIAKRPPQALPKDEWQNLVGKDETPPEFIEALISRDSRIFDNQYFVSFFANDTDSGISHYEAREGDGGFSRIESPYLIKDQSLESRIQIKAVDKAGNESITVPRRGILPEVPFVKYLVWLLAFSTLTVLFLGVKWFLRTKVRGGRKK